MGTEPRNHNSYLIFANSVWVPVTMPHSDDDTVMSSCLHQDKIYNQ